MAQQEQGGASGDEEERKEDASGPDGESSYDGSSNQSSDDETDGTETQEHSERMKRIVIIRIVVRVLMLIGLIVVMTYVSIDEYIDSYLEWVDEFGVWTTWIIFVAAATVFSTISPTGYLPTVLAGATFEIPLAFLVSYISVNAAAQLNMSICRKFLWRAKQFLQRRGQLTEVDALNRLIQRDPTFVVILFRVPFLGSGVLNYMFSLSNIDRKRYTVGNLIGFFPGSWMFSALGSSATSLFRAISSGDVDAKVIVIFCVEIVVTIFSVILVLRYVRKRKREALDEGASVDQQPEDDKRSPMSTDEGHSDSDSELA